MVKGSGVRLSFRVAVLQVMLISFDVGSDASFIMFLGISSSKRLPFARLNQAWCSVCKVALREVPLRAMPK